MFNKNYKNGWKCKFDINKKNYIKSKKSRAILGHHDQFEMWECGKVKWTKQKYWTAAASISTIILFKLLSSMQQQ